MKINIEELPNDEAVSPMARTNLQQRTRRIVQSSLPTFTAEVIISIMVQELKSILENTPDDDDYEEGF